MMCCPSRTLWSVRFNSIRDTECLHTSSFAAIESTPAYDNSHTRYAGRTKGEHLSKGVKRCQKSSTNTLKPAVEKFNGSSDSSFPQQILHPAPVQHQVTANKQAQRTSDQFKPTGKHRTDLDRYSERKMKRLGEVSQSKVCRRADVPPSP